MSKKGQRAKDKERTVVTTAPKKEENVPAVEDPKKKEVSGTSEAPMEEVFSSGAKIEEALDTFCSNFAKGLANILKGAVQAEIALDGISTPQGGDEPPVAKKPEAKPQSGAGTKANQTPQAAPKLVAKKWFKYRYRDQGAIKEDVLPDYFVAREFSFDDDARPVWVWVNASGKFVRKLTHEEVKQHLL